MKRALLLVLVGAVTACSPPRARVTGDAPADAAASDMASVFIAQPADFAGFRTWPSVPLGNEPNTADPPGARVAFVHDRPSPGATAYPLGAIIVKAIENSTDPTGWDLFAMAKRGGDFDPSGARGWEFFLLRLQAEESVQIVSRGSILDDPTDAGAAYGSAGAIFCSGCHGAPGTEATDHILSPQLAP